MHEQYLASLDRLRMLNSPSVDQRVKAIHCNADAVLADKSTVYDFEHDDTPTDLDWLWEHCPAGWNAHRVESGLEISIRTATSFVALTNPTRGDVLRLLGVFGDKS